jgi:HK97 family phage portal protein
MILRARGGIDRELRQAGGVWDPETLVIPQPWQAGTWYSSAGELLSVDKASGLPAVFSAIRLLAETTGRLPLRVYSGFRADKATAQDTWQWRLLHDRPNDERSAFDFWQDVAACLEGHGNAFLHKAKVGAIVEALFLLNPVKVKVRRNARSERVYVIQTAGGQQMELTAAEVLHIRGLTLDAGDVGMSPLQANREAIGTAVARYRTEGNLWRNNAAPSGAIKLPADRRVSRDEARDVVAIWMMHHGGEHTGTPAVLSGGSDWVQYGIPLKDAEYVAAHKFGVDDVARIFNIPAELLGGGELRQITEESSRRLLNFGLSPRLARITSALRSDPDLFPGDSTIYPEFYVEDFVSADALTQAQIRHLKIQDGSMLIDEARAEDGRPPLPDGVGQIPQITPVGGAPNPAAAAANDAAAADTARTTSFAVADHRRRLLPSGDGAVPSDG